MAAAAAEGARGRGARGKARGPGGKYRWKTEGKLMGLHILSGSLCAGGGLRGGGCRMDASLWSRLPDDILWRVLGFLAPTKRFQLHCMSRQWQRVLTSSHFRDTIAAAAPAAPDSEQQQQRQQGVVACVTPFPGYRSLNDNPRATTSSSGGGSGRKVKKAAVPVVVDVDLAAFVPAWFWKPPHKKGCRSADPYYDVVAAGDGLVCISNKSGRVWSWCDCEGVAAWAAAAAAATDRYYCVLNPATRTCVVLPPAPFHAQPPLLSVRLSAAALTLHMWEDVGGGYWEMKTATCDLPAAGGPRWSEVRKAAVPWPWPRAWWPPDVTAECGGGETFWYHAGRVHVLAIGGGGGAVDAAVVDTVDGPSVALQGPDAAATRYDDKGEVFLVAHRGGILLVAQPMRRGLTGTSAGAGGEAVAGVWRLARQSEKMVWEPVSRLDMWRVKRLLQGGPLALGAGERGGSGGGGGGGGLVAAGDVAVSGACVVRDLLCCQFRIRSSSCSTRSLLSGGGFFHGFVLALDLDAGHGGGWELVADDQALVYRADYFTHKSAALVDIRPDLFLS